MKTKMRFFLLALLFAPLLFSISLSSIFQTIYIEAQDALYKQVRVEIADPSVFTIFVRSKVTVFPKYTIRDPPIENLVVYRCGDMNIGTGFVVDPFGYSITASHVLDMSATIPDCLKELKHDLVKKKIDPTNYSYRVSLEYVARFSSDEKMPFKAVLDSPETEKKDISLILLAPKKEVTFKPIILSRANNLSDQTVGIIGAPYGNKDFFVVGKIGRSLPYEDSGQLMISGPIYPGNSGGIVFTLYDLKVVGMTDTVYTRNKVPTLMGTFVPSVDILDFLHDVLPDLFF